MTEDTPEMKQPERPNKARIRSGLQTTSAYIADIERYADELEEHCEQLEASLKRYHFGRSPLTDL